MTLGRILPLLATLYCRFDAQDALRHERRVAILAHLASEGPSSFARVKTVLGVDRSTLVHHARLLARTGHVKSARVGAEWYLALPSQQMPSTDPAPVAIVRAILREAGELPRATLHEMAAARALSRRRTNDALRRLVRAGAIQRRIEGEREIVGLQGS